MKRKIIRCRQFLLYGVQGMCVFYRIVTCMNRTITSGHRVLPEILGNRYAQKQREAQYEFCPEGIEVAELQKPQSCRGCSYNKKQKVQSNISANNTRIIKSVGGCMHNTNILKSVDKQAYLPT